MAAPLRPLGIVGRFRTKAANGFMGFSIPLTPTLSHKGRGGTTGVPSGNTAGFGCGLETTENTASAAFTPSPLMGEGRGEGETAVCSMKPGS